jgi:exosortase/archaeosortase family protein
MRRFQAWIAASIFLSAVLLFMRGGVLGKLSSDYIEATGVYPYAVLGLSLLLLYSKREILLSSVVEGSSIIHSLIGGLLVLTSLLMPVGNPAVLVFAVLLLWLGTFTALVGRAGLIPLAILGIYGFALVFPSFIVWLGSSFPLFTTIVLVSLLGPVLPISNSGQSIHFFDALGGRQSYFIDAGCSGSAALTVFLSVFFLMLLDRPIPRGRIGGLLLFGLAGTYVQNILRLVALVFAGYWFGADALWTTHTYIGYILFPLWFGVFAHVYLRQIGEGRVGLLRKDYNTSLEG